MAMQESREMYLETILILSQKNGSVRSIDIAEYMNYSKPSVSRAVGILKKDNMIKVDAGGYITLTKEGQIEAETIFERHTVLKRMFMALGIDEEIADEDACKIEHCISQKTFEAIKNHSTHW